MSEAYNGIGFSTAELERFKKQLRSFSAKKTKKLQQLTANTGVQIRHLAYRKAPFKLGNMRNAIRPIMGKSGLSVRVYAGMSYSAYVEFGTITKVSVPPELAEYAMQFKGKGKRKNGGMPARPFLYPAFKEQFPKYVKGIETIMQQSEQ